VSQRKYLVVGEVVKPHGIRGEVSVKLATDRPEVRFAVGARLLLGLDEESLEPVEVAGARPFKNGYLVKFESVTDRSQAEAIRGWLLFVGVEDLPPAEDGAFYHHELVGLPVMDEGGAELGRIHGVQNLGPYDLLEVRRGDGGSFFLPLVDRFVIAVDLEAGRLLVRLPDGLLDA